MIDAGDSGEKVGEKTAHVHYRVEGTKPISLIILIMSHYGV